MLDIYEELYIKVVIISLKVCHAQSDLALSRPAISPVDYWVIKPPCLLFPLPLVGKSNQNCNLNERKIIRSENQISVLSYSISHAGFLVI